MAGYDLVAYAERSIGNFFPLTRSHIYAELDRLGRAWACSKPPRSSRRPRPPSGCTRSPPAGTGELRHWLADPTLKEERSRSLFLVRIFFGDRSSPEQLAALLDDFESRAVIRRDRLAAMAEKLADRPGSVFRRSTAMFGVHREQANLDWVAEVRPMLLAAARAATPGQAG